MIEESPLAGQLRGLLGGLRAELRKLRRRPAAWILLGVAIAVQVLLSYFLNWLLITHPIGGGTPSAHPVQAKHMLYPAQLVANTMSSSGLVAALALILGVLVVGSEYGWGTYKTLLTQRPARTMTVLAKAAALLLAVGAAVLAFFAAGGASSALVALVDGQPLNHWPDAATVVKALLASWLTWGWWALFGSALAYAFRQSALPIGLGLAYRFVIEGLVLGLGGAAAGEAVRNVSKGLPGPNADALAQAFQGAPSQSIGPGQATLVLLLYSAAAIAAGALLVSRRDVS